MMTETVYQKIPQPRIPRRMAAVIEKVLKQDQPRAPLYHYTTLEGLRGIVNSGTMWASDLGFLNDPEEITYGATVIHDQVTRRLENSADPVTKGACKSILEAARFRRDSWKGPYSRCFSFSLSEADDVLSQWRGYAPNQDGVSIGFLSEALASRAEAQWFKFIKCRYELKEQQAIVDQLVDRIVAEARVASDGASYLTEGHSEASAWNEWSIPGVMVLTATFKRQSFAEEHEWRVVAAAEALLGPWTKFRMRERELIPYREFELGNENGPFSIERVLIGPGPNQELRELAVRGLVDQASSRHRESHTLVKVERSSITLR